MNTGMQKQHQESPGLGWR